MLSPAFLNGYFLIFGVAPALGIIAPPTNDSLINVINKISVDFAAWDWKREQFLKYSRDYPSGWPGFDCPTPLTAAVAQDVHHLSPKDIKVIGAVGDSLTAGRAAEAEYLSEVFLDYRGSSFATGAEKNLTQQASLYNIFAYFSPSLKGRSSGIGEADSSVAGFNLADSGGYSRELPNQVDALVRRIKANPTVDFENDWKLINIFIGSNDLCMICKNRTKYGAEQFADNMRRAVLFLRENLPRTFVNVLPPFHVEILLQTQADNAFCVDLQRAFCPCVFELTREEYAAIKRQFDASLGEFLTAEYQTKNFAVTISSGFNVEQLPTVGVIEDALKSLFQNIPNIAFFALDCFHFSSIAHDLVAKVIWRDLFTPIGSRTTVDLNQFQPQVWTCPSEDCPYLRTALNSQVCGAAENSFLDILSKRWVKYENAAYLPSMSELDRRAFMEEHGTVLILSVLGFAFLITIICLAIAFSCRNTELYPWEPNERTKLLNTKQLV